MFLQGVWVLHWGLDANNLDNFGEIGYGYWKLRWLFYVIGRY